MNPSKHTFLLSELKEVAQGRESQRRVLQRVREKQQWQGGKTSNLLVKQKKTVEELLEHFYKNCSHSDSGCIEWIGRSLPFGYGVTVFDGRILLVHRLAYMIAFLEDPHPKCVCHKCDNPKCVNPDHFFIGTKRDNNHDRNLKGRSHIPPQGELHNKAKLKEHQVLEIMARWNAGERNVSKLSREYNISRGSIDGIVHGRNWKNHLARSSPA